MVLLYIVELLCYNKGFGVIGFVDVVNFGFDDDIVVIKLMIMIIIIGWSVIIFII